MSATNPTSPRDHAAAILAEPSLERRRALLQRCPEDWRALVEEHVRTAFAKVAAYRSHMEGRREQAKKRPPAAPRRDDSSRPIAICRSAPEVGNAQLAKLRAAIDKGAA